MDDNTHQISRRRCDSSLDLSHIARTTRPSSLASGPGSGPGSVCVDVGGASTIVLMSMDRPRHPAFWRFAGVGVDGGGFDGFGACARTFATKSVSYRAPIANPCCFAPGNVDVDVMAEREAREDVDVREVAVPCERMEERSETEVCAEGGRERGRGGYGCGMATAAAEGGMGGGGGTRRVLVSEREELLAEGVRARSGEFTPEAMGEGVEPCEAKPPTEPRGWETGRWGSLGGCDEHGGGGGGGLVATASAGFPGGGGFWGRGGRAMGGRKEEGAETFSKDSSRLSPSSVPVPVQSRSIGNAVTVLAPPNGAESSPSEESETEWKEDTEEAATCPWARRAPSIVEKSASGG
jgi:hypothetical protein